MTKIKIIPTPIEKMVMTRNKYGAYKVDTIFGTSSISIMMTIGVILLLSLIVSVYLLFSIRPT